MEANAIAAQKENMRLSKSRPRMESFCLTQTPASSSSGSSGSQPSTSSAQQSVSDSEPLDTSIEVDDPMMPVEATGQNVTQRKASTGE